MIPLTARQEILRKIEGINKNYSPVGWYFNHVIPIFIEAVELLLSGYAIGGDFGDCEFLRTNGVESFDGVRFVQFTPYEEIEVEISYEEFLHFMKMTAALYVEHNPEDAAKVKEIFAAKGIEFNPLT